MRPKDKAFGWALPDLVAEAQRLRGLGYQIKAHDDGFKDEGDGCLWPIDRVAVLDWYPTGPLGRMQKDLFLTFDGRQFLFEQWTGPTFDPEPDDGWDEDPFDLC